MATDREIEAVVAAFRERVPPRSGESREENERGLLKLARQAIAALDTARAEHGDRERRKSESERLFGHSGAHVSARAEPSSEPGAFALHQQCVDFPVRSTERAGPLGERYYVRVCPECRVQQPGVGEAHVSGPAARCSAEGKTFPLVSVLAMPVSEHEAALAEAREVERVARRAEEHRADAFASEILVTIETLTRGDELPVAEGADPTKSPDPNPLQGTIDRLRAALTPSPPEEGE